MTLTPAITNPDALTNQPTLAGLLDWKRSAVQSVSYDRNELTIWIERGSLREACVILREDPKLNFNFLSDLTAVDWYPSDPRFEVVYHLLSIPRRDRVRLKVRLSDSDPSLDSVTSVWPAANFFEREVFDLFGIRFNGHPYLRRLLMPEDWEGFPLRKDYPVEGYR